MAAENEPLLVSYQKAPEDSNGTVNVHVYQAAAEIRRLYSDRSRKVARFHHLLGFVLLITIGFWTHWFGIPSLFGSVFGSGGSRNDNDVVGLGSTPLNGPLVLPESPVCHAHGKPHAYPLSSYPLEFGSEHSLTVLQNTTFNWHHHHDHDHEDKDDGDYRWRHVRVTGETVVRQVVDGKKPSIDVEALSNDDRIRTTYVWAKDTQKLTVVVDDRIWVEKGDWQHNLELCLVVRVTVWVPEAPAEKDKELHLKDLHIGNIHLGIQLIDNLDLVVDEAARLSSVVGSIVASRALPDETEKKATTKDVDVDVGVDCHDAFLKSIQFAPGYRFEARRTSVTTTSSPIRGPWSLVDSLYIFSVSGSVRVGVRAEGTADDSKDKELADLRIETVSGSIGFEELKEETDSEKDVVRRPHRLALTTRSGVAHGSGSFAETARLHTTSGNIAVALAIHKLAENGDNDDFVPASLDTDTVSGSTVVWLLNETTANDAVDFLESTHHSVSGSIELHYPTSWVGDIHLKTVAGGSLVVEGKGVHVVPDDSPHWPPRVGRKVDAIKEGTREGDEDEGKKGGHRSTLNADTVSGHVRLSFPQ